MLAVAARVSKPGIVVNNFFRYEELVDKRIGTSESLGFAWIIRETRLVRCFF